MAKIAITDWAALDPTPAVRYLEGRGHDVLLLNTTDPQELISQAKDAEGIISSFIKISAETMRQLPHLKVIATMAVGFNKIDVDTARELNIDVCNMPSAASEEVATHALAGMLSLLRELTPSTQQVKNGYWDYSKLPLPPRISELTLGLFSMGRIAREVARRSQPFFKEIVAYDPYVPSENWESGVRRVTSVNDLMQSSNVLSLHALLTEDTRGILDAEALSNMPQGSYIINVARGELMDKEALVSSLNSNHTQGAFLDVLDQEPPQPDDALVQHPRVQVTPHIAFRSEVTLREYTMLPAQNVDYVLSGKTPHTLVN